MSAIFSRGVEVPIDFSAVAGVRGSVRRNSFVDLFARKRVLNIGCTICFGCHSRDSYTRCFAGVVRIELQRDGDADYSEAGGRMTNLLIGMAKTSRGFFNAYLPQNLTRF